MEAVSVPHVLHCKANPALSLHAVSCSLAFVPYPSGVLWCVYPSLLSLLQSVSLLLFVSVSLSNSVLMVAFINLFVFFKHSAPHETCSSVY